MKKIIRRITLTLLSIAVVMGTFAGYDLTVACAAGEDDVFAVGESDEEAVFEAPTPTQSVSFGEIYEVSADDQDESFSIGYSVNSQTPVR